MKPDYAERKKPPNHRQRKFPYIRRGNLQCAECLSEETDTLNPRKPDLSIIGLGRLDQQQREVQDQHPAPRVRHALLGASCLDTTAHMTGSLASAVAWEAVGTVQTSDSHTAGVCEDDALLNLAES